MENTSDSFKPGPLLFCMKIERSVCYKVTDNNQTISQLRKGQSVKVQYFTDGYYENIAGILDAVNVINKELRIYTGFINDTGKELPTIIAFEDILEIGVNMT